MSEGTPSFQDLEPELRSVIALAEERNQVVISPLQQLAGGWSGALVYLVRVASVGSGAVEHVILKLDRKRPRASSDEIARHQLVLEKSPPGFAERHIPEMIFDRIETSDVMAIFYGIAGHSLLSFRTLSSFSRQSRIEALFSATCRYILEEWNSGLGFEAVDNPAILLQRWLGFRLDPGQKVEKFIQDTCGLPADIGGFITDGHVVPNPVRYARHEDAWGPVRKFDAAFGLQHGDLNTNNILAQFSRSGESLEGYFLIDFSLFKDDMPLFYDLRYLEMSYLAHVMARGNTEGLIDLVSRFSEQDVLDPDEAPIDMAGVNAVVRAARSAFGEWVLISHPSLQDDLWGQYWLAGTAAGLNFCHKSGQPVAVRLAGLVYAAANLKRYFELFGIPLPVEASQLTLGSDAASPSAGASGVLSEAGQPKSNLPVPLTSLVGRTRELAELPSMLLQSDVRLLSLTGPGGTGKTRLALELGGKLREEFADGVFFVELAQVTDPDLVSTTIAHAVGMREGGGKASLDILKEVLATKEMLLILDNLEQVVGAAPDISDLLAASPELKVLVTSRIPLHIRGEREYPVSPLPTPPVSGSTEVDPLDFDAVTLFCRQARFVKPDFNLDSQNQDAVTEICRQLDGLPLAIEIAAARVIMLPPRSLLKRLDRRLDLLVGKAQDLPDRQQTMRGTIGWSFDLLAPSSKAIFMRLGVFSGGFSLAAAEEICATMDGDQVFGGIETLLDNSMLRQAHSVDDEPRFEMLETIREYALEQADAAGISDELHWAHCGYFTRIALENQGSGVYGDESGYWLKWYEVEHDNFRQALAWGLSHPDAGAPAVIGMMSQLTWFWYRQGHLREGTEWTKRALELTEPLGESFERAYALTGRAMLALWSGELKVAESMGRQALEMADALRLDSVGPVARLALGTALINEGRHAEAYPILVDAVEMFDQQDDVWFKGTVLVHLANVSLAMGNSAEALKWLDTALPLLKETGDVWNLAFGMNNYGEVARVQGDYQRAEDFYRRTEALFQLADAKGDQARLVHTLGYMAMHRGEYEEARSLFQRSLNEFRELGNHRGIAECLAGMAGLGASEGRLSWAVPLLGAAEGQMSELGGTWWPADRVEIDRAKGHMQANLADDFNELWREGQGLTIEEAITYAMSS